MDIDKENKRLVLFGHRVEVLIDEQGLEIDSPEYYAFFDLSIQDFIELRDFINECILDRQEGYRTAQGCDHPNRVPYLYGYDYSDPGFSCSDCGYGT